MYRCYCEINRFRYICQVKLTLMDVKLHSTFMTKEIRKIILSEQAEMKVNCNCTVSQASATIKIIRNWGKIKDFRINGVPVSKMVEEM